MFSRHVGMLLGCMRSEGGTGSGEDARASARRAPAGYARTVRGGRSGPSAANASTVGTTVEKTADVTADAGTASTVLRIAPNEQQDAQALHFC